MSKTTKTIDMSHERGQIEELGTKRANIKSVGFFHQPESWEELQGWIERHAPEDRVHITTAAVMAWNLAARFDAHNEATESARMSQKETV